MENINLSIGNELKDKCPKLALGTIVCNVKNSLYNQSLWDEIAVVSAELQNSFTLETITTQPQIRATRDMYLACGKKPGRYRPSAEALMRRTLKGDGLYQINTLVDLINLLSMKTGYSIGGFDMDYIVGEVAAGIAVENEPYEGIGKGQLNVHGLPILRDAKGGIGTPTSDEVRTAIRLETTRFFMNINGYTGRTDLVPAIELACELLEKYVEATDIIVNIVE